MTIYEAIASGKPFVRDGSRKMVLSGKLFPCKCQGKHFDPDFDMVFNCSGFTMISVSGDKISIRRESYEGNDWYFASEEQIANAIAKRMTG
jgi:hypothetical protein